MKTTLPEFPVEHAVENVTVESDLLDAAEVREYLALLDLPWRSPSIDALNELVTAHVTRVPFENISKLYYKNQFGLTRLPSIEEYLQGIEQYHFGGTCYSNNFRFYTLLKSLGYEVKLCSADMATPHVHMVSIVEFDHGEYLADTGYAAPFLLPLPRFLKTDHVVALGRDRYVLKPQDASGRSRLELYRDGLLKHGYVVNPAPRRFADFSKVIADSFRKNATFLNSILLARFFPGHSLVIHNFSVIESWRNRSVVYAMEDKSELIAAMEEHFGIPSSVVTTALSDLGPLVDAWGGQP